MSGARAERVRGRFWTSGTWVLFGLMAVGFSFGLARFFTGLGAVTNLSDAHPWGLWIAVDVACGVALAAGGFTTAALVEIFGRERYAPLLRPAILTAWLGYALVGFALLFDLGRYWNIWRPAFHWQGNSVLFEVGLCVMTYLVVLSVEMAGPVIDGLVERARGGEWGAPLVRPFVEGLGLLRGAVHTVLPLFVVAGVVLSCMHQSSLGALMVIAPTKVSPLWYTPFLPLLFLLSALMVGFPMVIVESLLASRGTGRRPEMEILTPLARRIPLFIGAYAVLKIGDLVVRRPDPSTASAGQIVALCAELCVGIVLPIALLTLRTVRRSPGWLFVAALLVVAGVAINRINVFLVAYTPPFAEGGYSPSLGEVAVTVAMIATLVFLYRVCVFFFPILAAESSPRAERAHGAEQPAPADPGLPPRWAWAFRGATAPVLLGFVAIYASVHGEAVSGEIRALAWGENVAPVEMPLAGSADPGHVNRPEGYKTVYLLRSSVADPKGEYYEPSRFTHVSHDELTGGDCGICHHRVSWDDEDRVGDDLATLHEMFDVRIGGPCSTCHDMESITIQRCSSCHRAPNEPDHRTRPGLRGAFHRLCIGCHEDETAPVEAPTECTSCHHPLTPDHADFVGRPVVDEPRDVTAVCLECHEKSGRDLLRTAHWKWSGHSPSVCGHEHEEELGLRTLVNNHAIGVGGNLEYCATCHVGLGCIAGRIPFEGPGTMDCLVCHDTTGEYAKQVGGGGAPEPGLDLVTMARSVGRPSRASCGRCHFHSDGGANLKHGDLEPALADPPDELDVHMGRYDMLCQDCHTTKDHRIAGMSVSAPAVEGRVLCVHCHGPTPHGISGPLSRHLDQHLEAVSCETCHVPLVAQVAPTRTFVDFEALASTAPIDIDPVWRRPIFAPDSGVETWVNDYVPEYRWYDGTREVTMLDEEIDPSGVVHLNLPRGERHDPSARITPFKVHRARQPYDRETSLLLVPLLAGGLWDGLSLDEALRAGAAGAGTEYSGSYGMVDTVHFAGLHHQVGPSPRALACADCHEPAAVSCSRCHTDPNAASYESAIGPSDPQRAPRLDFEALGYDGDPAIVGGRFRYDLGRGEPGR
jgi:octaheme c-type cytochrome (tetrathionate reductase family)